MSALTLRLNSLQANQSCQGFIKIQWAPWLCRNNEERLLQGSNRSERARQSDLPESKRTISVEWNKRGTVTVCDSGSENSEGLRAGWAVLCTSLHQATEFYIARSLCFLTVVVCVILYVPAVQVEKNRMPAHMDLQGFFSVCQTGSKQVSEPTYDTIWWILSISGGSLSCLSSGN